MRENAAYRSFLETAEKLAVRVIRAWPRRCDCSRHKKWHTDAWDGTQVPTSSRARHARPFGAHSWRASRVKRSISRSSKPF